MGNVRKLVVLLAVILAMLIVLPVMAQSPTIIVSNNPTLGNILTDAQGRTLYMFTKDTPNTSNCSGGCLAAWPPLIAAGAPTKGDGISGTLSTTATTDGRTMVVYNDMPLYYFARDANPGDVNGQGVNGVWFAVHPDAPSVVVKD